MSSERYSTCPYTSLNDKQYWRQSVAEVEQTLIDPVIRAPFKITETDKVATAGSCFAQHIARNLSNKGFHYFVAEDAPQPISNALALKYSYRVFSARFGNIYTARQLLQLFDRAYGDFVPEEQPWERGGRLFDPFRPSVERDGYLGPAHYAGDLARHMACVRRMFEELDVFVFTLGLTECWRSKIDGAVFPVAPGCGFGRFDPDRYEFHNFRTSEVVADLGAFVEKLRSRNPRARIILTVSPVPLIATYEDRHVLVSTGYSKAALRAAADEVERSFRDVAYFPSYEIITGQHARGAYYAPDLREVEPSGVSHVMNVFFKHFADKQPEHHDASAEDLAFDVVCDEKTLVEEL